MKENMDKNQTVDVDKQVPCSGIQRSNLKNIYKQVKEKNAERIQKNSKPKHRNPIKITTHHKELVEMLRLHLDESRTLIIAIDGVDGSRKSTLAHYLGWQLSMSAIETDLCRKQRPTQAARGLLANGKIPPLIIDPKLLSRLIQACRKLGDSIIVEGIFVLQSLEDIEIKPDYLIRMKKPGWLGSFDFTKYDEKFSKLIPDYEFIVGD